MQSLHPRHGSIQEYSQELSDPSRYRPDHCPLCDGRDPLRAHGFYCRTLVDVNYDGTIPVRRYLCLLCKRTVSLLPEFALPYLRFSIQVIGLFLVSLLLYRRTLREAAAAASQPNMPYQRGQFWVRRFQQQTVTLCVALVSLTTVVPATDFLTRALQMLEGIGWIVAHRFLFAERRAEEIAARKYEIPYSERTSLSVDTLLDWALRYRRGGFPALAPKQRCDRGQSRVVAPQLAELIERLKRENPHRTGMTLLRELALVSSTGTPAVSAATLYRFLKQRGLTTRQLLAAPAHKKFEAERSNQIWQSDMLFGPYVQRSGGGRMQVFLYAVLDDASRLLPHAQFYSHQGLDAFLDCLRQAVAARGVCTRLYVDNAKVFRSSQLARIAASIGILITHTPPYQPQGRGKIERFFRSLREQFLANLDPQRTLTLEELNQRLWVWIEQVYHRSEHS